MDGRNLYRWWFAGFLAIGAVGCNRHAVQSPWDAVPNGIPPAVTAKKSFWGGNKAVTPVDAVAAEPVRKGPMMPETMATLADVQLASALDEKTQPASREILLDKARQGYQKALQREPKCKPAMLGLARYYGHVNEHEKCIEMYKKYLTAYPTDKDVAHEVAKVHVQWEDWNGALTWCDAALKMDPENLGIRKTRAFCLARSGQLEKAFAVFCEIMPEAQARYNMARVLEHVNRIEDCRLQLTLALKADPNYVDAQEFLAEVDTVRSGKPLQDPNTVIHQAGHVQQP